MKGSTYIFKQYEIWISSEICNKEIMKGSTYIFKQYEIWISSASFC